MAKFVIFAVFCLLGATLSKAEFNKEEAMKKFTEFADSCMQETGATKADFDDLKKEQPASGKEGKCLRACILKKYDVMDNNGKFVKSVALEHAKKIINNDAEKMKMADEIINACAGIDVSDDHCEAAESYGKCLRDQAVAHGIKKSDLIE